MTYYKYYFYSLLLASFNFAFSQTNFGESENIPSTFPTASELADLDGDGDLDLVRTMTRTTGLDELNANEIWLNDGSGNFSLHQSFGNSESKGLDIGDLDGDGDLDIFVANATFFIGASSISANKVWLNDGEANFSSNGQLLGTRTSKSISLGDFDNDSDLDAYVSNSGSDNSINRNTVWLNNGSGFFSYNGQSPAYVSTQDSEVLDVDGDNDLDVITANLGSPNNVWLNNGSGFFSLGQSIGNAYTEAISIADFDGDLDKDIVFSNTFDESKSYENDGNGNFIFHSNIISFPVAQRKTIRFSDFDNDGDNDLIVAIFTSLYEDRILINDGSGNFTEDFLFTIRNTWDVSIGDINNDGLNDVFMLNINNQNSEFWVNKLDVLSTEHNSKINIKAYPNPTSNEIIIDLGKLCNSVEVNIENFLGQKILSKTLKNSQIIKLPLNGPQGLYFINLKTDSNKIQVIKVIKS